VRQRIVSLLPPLDDRAREPNMRWGRWFGLVMEITLWAYAAVYVFRFFSRR
jgi:hypothetical protein